MDPRSRRVPSAAFDDGASIRSRAYHSSNHGLRPAESRYSLREQFAATRREYEFGFDDASSVLERATIASEAVRGDEFDDTAVVDAGSSAFPESGSCYRDCYELLCLPREASLSPDQVRDAAHRLIQVLAVDRQPPRLQSPAAFYLGLAQAAFETLVEPSRKLGYDLSGADDPGSDSEDVSSDADDLPGTKSQSYEGKLQEQYLLLTHRESRATTDLGVRVDAVPLLSPQPSSRRQRSRLKIVDISLRKSTTVSLPGLRKPIDKAIILLGDLANRGGPRVDIRNSLRLTDPTLTITGSTHGLLDEPFKLAPLLLDRYQPPGPAIHGPRRMEQLLVSRFLPVLDVNFRQELFWRTEPRLRALPDLVVEQDLELLPQPSTTTRIGHSITFSGSDEPLNIEFSARKLLTRKGNFAPSLGLAVHQRVGAGTAFLVADGGDWNLRTSRECRELSNFSKISGGFASMTDVFKNPPTVELGYAFGRQDLGMQSGQAFTKPSERGLATLDYDLEERKPTSWTVSTGLTPGNAAAYLRYGRDLFAPPTPNPSRRSKPASFRAEVELASTTHRDFFLAFRALKRIGRFSKAGLEIGLSPSNLHLSLYWSRLGQRISLPFLTAARAQRFFNTKLLFWTTVFPFAALAAWELYRQRCQRGVKSQAGTAAAAAAAKAAALHKEKKLQEHIARRRAEADELTVILATGAEPRQARERQRGGLVIVSAKYGVRDAPPEEVADVTIAVAALVDDRGRLVIPAGLRKGAAWVLGSGADGEG
ncbi:hypothetical protein NEMBOFW57_002487 [Staphylotrichum longicolle]|uniref:J domain-containing protein n=1 Tax=Staphylotrichum longicolle TaxID=669026 RepID=A0AAD4F3F4_9PEZI|nr:hypothetical protein NEMBOFW57_002487 [Staphylotrichum longicolle]